MRQRLSQIPHLMPVLGYLALSLLTMATALPSFMVAIPGGPVAETDGWQNVWNLWWVQRALATPTNPFFTPLLFYPEGVDLTLQTLNITNGLLFAPITALFGPIAAYNSAILAALILSGVGGYALALRVSGDRLAAFIGGAVFAFSPFHLTKIWDGQLELVALQWIAFYGLFLLRAAEDLRRRDALLAGLFLALIGYTSWYYLYFFGIYSLLFAALWLGGAPRAIRPARLRQFALAALSGSALLAPLLIGASFSARSMLTISNPWFDPNDPVDSILIHSANLYDLLLPNGLHPVWGSAIEALARTWHPYVSAWNIAPGYVALALALAALIRARAAAWRWAVIGLVATLLALGPIVQIGATRTGIPLPYQVILATPGMELARRPSHFIVILTLMLAPLAALGIQALRAELTPRHGRILVGVVAALMWVEYLPPIWPHHTLDVPDYYRQIAANPGAVLEIPPRTESSAPLKAQIIHGQPLLGGFVSRRPFYTFAEQAPGIRQLWRLRPDQTAMFIGGADDGLVALNYYGVRHLVVQWDGLRADQQVSLRDALHQTLGDIAPVYADEKLSAYDIAPVAPRPFAYFSDGWQPEETDGARRWRWMGERGDIVLANPLTRDIPIVVSLYVQAYQQERSVSASFAGQMLGDFAITPGGNSMIFRLLLPPGEHRLNLTAPATSETTLPRRMLSIVAIDARLHATP